MEDHHAKKCRETTYVVQATSFETLTLWGEWHCFVKWEQDTLGFWKVVGKCARKPVAVSVCWYIVNGKRVAFYEYTSQVVDHRMVEAWLTKTFPCMSNYEPGRRPHCDAMNFVNAMSVLWPHEARSERLMVEMKRRFQEGMREFV